MAKTETNYAKLHFIIFAILLSVCLLQVFIATLKLAAIWHISILSLLAVFNAFLVGYYYMHLFEEMKWLKFIALIPLFAFMYAVVVVAESVAR